MQHKHHEQAAEHHEEAAKHHRKAQKHTEEGNDEKAGYHAHAAQGHQVKAKEHANEAAKKQSDKAVTARGSKNDEDVDEESDMVDNNSKEKKSGKGSLASTQSSGNGHSKK